MSSGEAGLPGLDEYFASLRGRRMYAALYDAHRHILYKGEPTEIACLGDYLKAIADVGRRADRLYYRLERDAVPREDSLPLVLHITHSGRTVYVYYGSTPFCEMRGERIAVNRRMESLFEPPEGESALELFLPFRDEQGNALVVTNEREGRSGGGWASRPDAMLALLLRIPPVQRTLPTQPSITPPISVFPRARSVSPPRWLPSTGNFFSVMGREPDTDSESGYVSGDS